MRSKPVIALLDDDPLFRKDMANLFADDFEIRSYAAPEDLYESLRVSQPDLLLLDLDLGEKSDGFAVHEELERQGHAFPVMLLTVHAGSRTTARAVERDLPYLHKDRDIEDVEAFRSALLRAIEHHLLETEVRYYRGREARTFTDTPFPWPESCGDLETRLRTLLEDEGPVVLLGESGTGKLTAARWLHGRLDTGAPLVTLTARGRDVDEFERELYGAEDGGPREPGALAAASRGMVLIVGAEELPEASLQRLQLATASGSYRPLGSMRPRRLGAKVVLTCLRDEEEPDWPRAVQEAWKSRIAVLPPLRLRPEDLPFHARTLARLHGQGDRVPLDARSLEVLAGRRLTGNFHDLAVAVQFGVEALEATDEFVRRSRNRTDCIRLKDLHRLGWSGAMSALEVALAISIHEEVGWDNNAWMGITGLPRSTMARKKKLARDALEEPES